MWGALGSRSSAIIDLDRDGDLDLITGEFHAAPRLLLSDLAEQTEVKSLEVVLRGEQSNRDGLGATVTVQAGDLRQSRFHNGKSGYLSQSSLPLYFGLGDAKEIDFVEVLWPSGEKQVVRDGLSFGSRLVVREPRSSEGSGQQ